MLGGTLFERRHNAAGAHPEDRRDPMTIPRDKLVSDSEGSIDGDERARESHDGPNEVISRDELQYCPMTSKLAALVGVSENHRRLEIFALDRDCLQKLVARAMAGKSGEAASHPPKVCHGGRAETAIAVVQQHRNRSDFCATG
jgi:hypothetical protein